MPDSTQYFERLEEINFLLASLVVDSKEIQSLYKEQSSLIKITQKFSLIYSIQTELSQNTEMAKLDGDMQDMVYIENQELKERLKIEIDELKELIDPSNIDDDKNAIIEIRGGAGGDEAALFGGDLYRMYTRYANSKHFKVEQISGNFTDGKGVKEVSFIIKGENVYKYLKYESGVHRVQRVPTTESSGRIHTSTATVAVLPEIEDVNIIINANDLKIDVYRSSGHGGQSVNTTDSAVRITHLPTGVVVICQDSKSQIQNRETALTVLKSRLYQAQKNEADKQRSDLRHSQIGTGDRSEKIRTYNYPQDRVTDHRVKMSWHNIPDIIDGNIDEMLQYINKNIKQNENWKSTES